MFFAPAKAAVKVRSTVMMTEVPVVMMLLLAAFMLHWEFVAMPGVPGVKEVTWLTELLASQIELAAAFQFRKQALTALKVGANSMVPAVRKPEPPASEIVKLNRSAGPEPEPGSTETATGLPPAL